MYTLPGVVGIEKDFKLIYDKYPIVKLNRRFNSIEIFLQAPEISEHLENVEREEYEHKLEIEDKFKNIDEESLSKIIIDKYIEAIYILKSKLKKDDIFNVEILLKLLSDIKSKINFDFLNNLNREQEIKINIEKKEKAIEKREYRKKGNFVKDQNIQYLRVYSIGLPEKFLYPYDYQYTEIFRNLLSRKNLLCPRYHHLYILVAQTMEEALISSFDYADWYIYGLALIDKEKYIESSEKEKEIIVFNIISTGLKDIANIDNLDKDIIEDTISTIQEKWLNTELEHKTFETNDYNLIITYFSRSMEEECPIYFNLTDKKTNKSSKIQIGKADKKVINYWLKNISISKGKIKVKSSDSVIAGIYLENKPKIMEFDINSLLNNNKADNSSIFIQP